MSSVNVNIYSDLWPNALYACMWSKDNVMISFISRYIDIEAMIKYCLIRSVDVTYQFQVTVDLQTHRIYHLSATLYEQCRRARHQDCGCMRHQTGTGSLPSAVLHYRQLPALESACLTVPQHNKAMYGAKKARIWYIRIRPIVLVAVGWCCY